MEVVLESNNLYSLGFVIEDKEQDTLLLQRNKAKLKLEDINTYHTVNYEDRIDLIAYKYYKDIVKDSSKFWWLIADVNDISNPLDLSSLVGKKIIIPDLLATLIYNESNS